MEAEYLHRPAGRAAVLVAVGVHRLLDDDGPVLPRAERELVAGGDELELGCPSFSLMTTPAISSLRRFGLATVTTWNFWSPRVNGAPNFRQSLQSPATFAVSAARPVTATPEESSMVVRICSRENGVSFGPASSFD